LAIQKYSGILGSAKDGIGTTLDTGHRYRHQKERRHLAEPAEAERGSYLFQDMQARSKPFSFSASLQIIALSSVAGPLVGNELLSFKPGIVFRTTADCAIVYIDLEC